MKIAYLDCFSGISGESLAAREHNSLKEMEALLRSDLTRHKTACTS